MATQYGPEHEKKRKKERELVNAPVNWQTLSAQFDLDRTGSIDPVYMR
jgi:hypothetical protein